MKHAIILIALFSVALAAPFAPYGGFVKGRRVHKKPTEPTTEEAIIPDYTKDTETPEEPKLECMPDLIPPSEEGYATIDQSNKCNDEKVTTDDEKVVVNEQHTDDEKVTMDEQHTDDDKVIVDEQQSSDEKVTINEQHTDDEKVITNDDSNQDQDKMEDDQYTIGEEQETSVTEADKYLEEHSISTINEENKNDDKKPVEEVVTLSIDLMPPLIDDSLTVMKETPKKPEIVEESKFVKGVKGRFNRRKMMIDNN